MFIEERHQEIIKIIKEKGRISISEIQEKFNISVESARRDLRILEEQGMLKRTYGGAIELVQVGAQAPRKMDPRKIENIKENYVAIAREAVKYIREDDVVYITSATIGYFMTKFIPDDINITVVTNSIVIADELKYKDNVTVYVVGGKMRAKGSIVDSFAAEFVKNMHFDISFMTGAGFSEEFGLSNGTHETALFQKNVINNSRKNVALMPNEKIGFNSFIKVVDAEKFDLLITDWDAVEDELVKFESLEIKVVVVDK